MSSDKRLKEVCVPSCLGKKVGFCPLDSAFRQGSSGGHHTLVPGITGLLPLCPRNVSSVRSGGKEPPAAVCSAPMAAVQLPST